MEKITTARKELEAFGFKSFLAPLAAGIALGIVAIMVAVPFPDLTGANMTLAYSFVVLLPIAAALGAISSAANAGAVVRSAAAHNVRI